MPEAARHSTGWAPPAAVTRALQPVEDAAEAAHIALRRANLIQAGLVEFLAADGRVLAQRLAERHA